MDIWTQLGRFSEFETQRLLMRSFAFKDHKDFYEIARDAEFGIYFSLSGKFGRK